MPEKTVQKEPGKKPAPSKKPKPQQEVVVQIPLSELHPFPDHPFQVREDASMQETAESVKEYGVLVPALARPREDGGYELIAGHRRKHACELAGLATMPVIVRDIDRDAATIIMVDSNLQRENILPSERAKAYKMKMEAIKRQGARTDLTSPKISAKFRSDDEVGQDAGVSGDTIRNYIALTQLVPELQQMVDEKKIALSPAYQLAALTPKEQGLLLRQSFVPGEITPEDANRLGCELAKRFTKGNHAYIVCTHIDKAHIHNHVIWNSTALSQTRKFRNFWGSSRAVRRLNDTICIENGYSIVENPKRHGKSYNKWLGDKKKPSHRERICAAIDDALAQKPDSFEALLELLRQAGYEVKGKKVPSLLGGEQKKSIRMDTLGDGYTPADLRAVIAGEKAHTPQKNAAAPVKPEKRSGNLLVDIQAKLRAGKGAGYARWATLFNLKQMAQTVAYLQDHELLDYAVLSEKAAAASAHFNELSARIKSAEKRMAEIAVLREHIVNYAKTRDTYVAYRKAGYSKKFLAEHESEITIHKAAKNYFDGLGFKKLPTIKALNTEYAELLAEKKAAYADYRKAREEMKELLTAKANIDRILELDKEQEEANERREKEAEQR